MTIRGDTDELISFLNSLVAIDPGAMAELLSHHVDCNDGLVNHPTVQVISRAEENIFPLRVSHIQVSRQFRVGLLGILNGYCGVINQGNKKGYGPITVQYRDGKLVGFERTETGG